MNTLYVYRTDDSKHVATVTGETNAECEWAAEKEGYYPDTYAWTYSPGFGVFDGLVENTDALIFAFHPTPSWPGGTGP